MLSYPSVKAGHMFLLDLLYHVDTVNIEGIHDVKALKDANIVVVEDIVDTRNPMGKLAAKFQEFSPTEILISCLLCKRSHVACFF